jgi:hypothetical protein
MCFKNRRYPSILVTVLSVFLILFGIVIMAQAIIYETRSSVLNTDLGTYKDISIKVKTFRQATFALLVVGAIATMVTGCAGTMCVCKPCKPIWCSMIFGTVLMGCMVLFLVVGSIITGLSMAGPKHIDAFCQG